MATVDHAVQVAKGAAQGYEGFLRIGICDSLATAPHRLAAGAQPRGDDGLVAEPAWSDPVSVIVPACRPLLADVQVKLEDALGSAHR